MPVNNAGKRFLFLIGDAAIYLGAAYIVQQSRLLYAEGVLSPGLNLGAVILCLAAVFSVSVLHEKHFGRQSAPAAAADALIFLAIALGPVAATELVRPEAGMSFSWMPTEWLKLPRAILFGLKISFPFFMLYTFFILAGLYLMVKKGWRFPLVIAAGAAVAAALYCTSTIDLDERAILYVMMMCPPAALAAAALWLRSERMAGRSFLLLLVVMTVLPFYFGLVPWFPGPPPANNLICTMSPGCSMQFEESGEQPVPGAEKLYPAPCEKAEFPLVFMRDIYYDRSMQMLFSTYGPTCGFVRLDMSSGEMEVMKYRSLIRYLWSEEDLPYILAPDWIYSGIITIDKKTFRITGRASPHLDRLRVPMQLVDDGDYLYLLSTELPMLVRFDRETLQLAGYIDFYEMGLTPHSHGAYAMALDPSRGYAFVQLGVYDVAGRFRLVRVNLGDLSVSAARWIRTGSTIMTALPEKGSVLMYDYYGRAVTEVDAETLDTRRTFDGVVNCRATVYDSRRDLLYMVGSGFGELAVIDYASGEIIADYHLGNRAGSLYYSDEEDALYAGSGSGIYRIDAAKLTGRKIRLRNP